MYTIEKNGSKTIEHILQCAQVTIDNNLQIDENKNKGSYKGSSAHCIPNLLYLNLAIASIW
jgi:hypothetical protein